MKFPGGWFSSLFLSGNSLPRFANCLRAILLCSALVIPVVRARHLAPRDPHNGHVFRVGVAPMVGNSAFDKEIVLRGLTEKPKRAMINYFHDVLCTQ